MSKNLFLFLIILLASLSTVSAGSVFVNGSYVTQGGFIDNLQDDYGFTRLTLHSAGLEVTYLGGEEHGFYGRLNPYISYGFKDKNDTEIVKFSELSSSVSSYGVGVTLGYGMDLNFDRFGIAFGGGIHVDGNNLIWEGMTPSTQMTASIGLGVGGNAYFHPGKGGFVINLSVFGSWIPFTVFSNDNYLDQEWTGFSAGTLSFAVGIGAGWRF